MSSYFKQQYRWCTGSLRLLSEPLFWESNLPNKAKLCYLAGFNYYIQSALYLFVLPSLIISLLVFFPQHFNIADYAVILPAIAVMTVAYPLWHRCRFGPAAWSIRVVQQWTYVFAIFDFIREATIPWDATGSTVRSVASTRRYSQFKFAVVGWNGLITIAWGGLAVWRMAAGDWVSFVFVAAMGCYWVAVTYRVIFSLRSAR
jgi:cellulose synthase (UDP-forming)